MKKQFFFSISLIISSLSFAQSSLDSLRLVLPVGHSYDITSISFGRENKVILTSCGDGIARLFETTSGKELQKFIGHKEWINSAVFSEDFKYILTASRDKTARIFDINTGKEIQKFSGHKRGLISAYYSPKGNRILTASRDNTAKIFDVSSGRLIHTLKGHQNYINSAIFNSDATLVLTSSADKTARIYNAESGRQIKLFNDHSNEIITACFSPDYKKILTAGKDGYCFIYNANSGRKLFEIFILNQMIKIAKFSPDGKLIVLVCNDSKVRIYNTEDGQQINTIEINSDKIKTIDFSPVNSKIIIGTQNSYAYIFNILNDSVGSRLIDADGYINNVKYSENGKIVISSSSEKNLWVYDVLTGKELNLIKGQSTYIISFVKSRDNKLCIFLCSDNTIRLIELNSGRQINFIENLAENIISVAFGDTHDEIITTSIMGTITIHNIQKNNKKIINCGFDEPIHNAVLSPDKKSLLISGIYGKISVFDILTGIELVELKGHSERVSASFSKNGKYIVTAGWDGNSIVYDTKTGAQIRRLCSLNSIINSAVFSPSGDTIIVACKNKKVILFDRIKNKQNFEFSGHTEEVYSAVFSSDGKSILTTSKDNKVRVFDNNGDLLRLVNGHLDDVYLGEFIDTNKQIISTSYDHKTIVWDLENVAKIYEIIQLKNNNWLVKLSNSSYYMCSKDASKMLHYVTPGLKVIGFEQLDPVYNRPDIVLDSIGKYFGGADKELVTNYLQSWEKRIDRLGLDKEKLGKGEIAVPNAEIVGADDIAYENKEGKLNIKVSANDSKYPLRRFNVYVNEVPLYGSVGISIAHLKKQVWDTTVSVPLSVGENKIQVSVMNELGLENFKYPTYVNYTPEKDIVAKTHYIGIGVNAFKDSNYNLNYCVKDVRDLAKAFTTENKNIDTLIYTDKQVTKENILALKDYLNKTSVNDKVIISCSSHGLLDDSINFYLAMHDVNFNNPKARGLKYEELESLLDGIPARQKLLLLDACNSGENDKTEVLKQELQQKEKNMDSTQILAARGVIIKLEEENKSNFKKMNELFVNVRNNTGSVIISAAGGQESALEAIQVDGKTIENGAFTYSILECLKQNQGKELKVNTLKQYAEKRVEEITNGKQKPTSRQETMEVDWGVR
jgi:WD40 repeat protein